MKRNKGMDSWTTKDRSGVIHRIRGPARVHAVSVTLRSGTDFGMIAWRRSFFALARLGLIAVTVTACGAASGYLTPSGSTTTLMAGWERHFLID